MFSFFKIFTAGMVISFLGSLPLGTLNIAAMQIAVQETVRRALAYALGVAIVEILYVRLSLKGIDWIIANRKVFYILEWVTVVLFLVLAVSSFIVSRRLMRNKRYQCLMISFHAKNSECFGSYMCVGSAPAPFSSMTE